MTDLKSAATALIEASEKASPAPWLETWGPITTCDQEHAEYHQAWGPEHAPDEDGVDDDAQTKAEADAVFIALSRNASPRIARAYLKALDVVEALKIYLSSSVSPNDSIEKFTVVKDKIAAFDAAVGGKDV